ncbi:cysteine and histidine-rich domain-containing protein 1 isoform X2 [Hydra vulgaris]|uniref:Cysteine and histidine-rich domain-containing protein 1 isoform X2 n=1 Tax=Hydra vulgaris TaxID=6087 RepID=A0ABM4BJ51_HYDVU
MNELICYNKGCNKKFFEEDNKEECQFHPGIPVFHDAYKGWSCCKKKSTDFTEFLNMPGCTKGKHNPVKPEAPKKNIEKPMEIGEIIKESAADTPKNTFVTERPRDDLPKSKLEYTVSPSLITALEKCKEKQASQLKNGDNISDLVQPGAPCKHNTCNTKYLNESSNNLDCVYHPGSAVFHEGYKFWTCCQKRTSDFDQFLNQQGCETGKHDWMKPSEIVENKSNCRFDWHQTSSYVILSIYAKVSDPEKSTVEANPTGVSISIAFNGGTNTFSLDLKLNGVIDPEKSSVEYLGTKVELKLKKADAVSWPKFELTSN